METALGRVASLSLDLRVMREEDGMEILKGVIAAIVGDAFLCLGDIERFGSLNVVEELRD